MTRSDSLGTRELRDKYLRFFESKAHVHYPSAPLIPYDVTGRLDESLLFTGAGMVQFKPFFRGVATPPNPRLVTVQKCVRTGDIESVGDLNHLTFFEMLGNFSFGDYFKKDAIDYSWEFLTSPDWLALESNRLCFTVFEEDDEAYELWSEKVRSIGIEPSSRVFRLGEDTNYWPAGAFSDGPPGPCGPNAEMFYWVEGDPPEGPYSREDFLRDDEAGKWLEVGNDVFIQFEWQGELRNPDRPADGYVKTGMPPLPFQSVDDGRGLERTATVIAGLKSVYETDAFQPILRKIEEVAHGYRYGSVDPKDTAARIIADHIRTAVFCIADGVLPGNSGRGYVLRRLIRRAVLKGQRVLGLDKPFFHLVFEGVVEGMGDFYGELHERREIIVETLKNEEKLFRRTTRQGAKRLETELRFLVFSCVTRFALLAANQGYVPSSPLLAKAVLLHVMEDPEAEQAEMLHDLLLSREIDKSLGEEDEDYLESVVPDQLGAGFDLTNARAILAAIAEESQRLSGSQASKLQGPTTLGGDVVFRLYDTYGFPLEVTKELCAEAGVAVDEVGYEEALLEAQERSRAGSERESVYGGVQTGLHTGGGPTVFRGYEEARTLSRVVAAKPVPESEIPRLALVLDQTPFYAESGGQISDTGTIRGPGFEGAVIDVIKQAGVFIHEMEVVQSDPSTPKIPHTGLEVEAQIDVPRRMRIMRNHTATHLLHAALRKVLGKHVAQAGSYVGPDHLRFDFTHGKPMNPDELAMVEFIVNEEALKNTPVRIYADLPIAEAKKMGAMALFGEKYGDRVRMVEIGEFSRELCGGTHLHATGEIGLFKITSESSAASGVRRIEAVSGEGAYRWVLEQTGAYYEAASRLKTAPKDLLPAIERLQEQLREERRRREKAETALARGGQEAAGAQSQEVKGVFLWTRKFEGVDPKVAAASVDDAVAQNADLVALAAVVGDRVQWICKVGSQAVTKGAHAGQLVKQVATVTGGGGGGRPDFATAGGKDPSKVADAFLAAAEALEQMLG